MSGRSKIVLVRVATELDRRIPKASDSELAGRVILFTALLLAPFDRSSLNRTGEVNLSHS